MAVRDSAQKTMSIATQIASVTHRFGAITPKEPLAIVAMSVSMVCERSRRAARSKTRMTKPEFRINA
jgi:hypothetical protein